MEVQTLKGVDLFLFQPLVGRGIYTVVRQTNQKTMKFHNFMVKTCKGCIDSISGGAFHGVHLMVNNISMWFHPFTGNQLTKGHKPRKKNRNSLLN